ncbi:hypothetical protein HAN_2g276 (nucleomorph) [Hemiselmis andersenii]|uniref:Uncharacterized protein n=1 Tax=Hemiselmis andersenii TaxID=464988 RepID=A9BKU3_HEMAN|nr:hypothetical protein HAN_2g276 [Hemiselmis andersenii]ABW98098.1 hypothetical protein HAN_2g276 [Hemiselmis andersenii]
MPPHGEILFFKNLTNLILNHKDIGNVIIINSNSDRFLVNFRKIFELKNNPYNFKQNLIQFDLKNFENQKPIVKKIIQISNNFCFSEKSFYPFFIILFNNFEKASIDFQTILKNLIITKSTNLRFFFFCKETQSIDSILFSFSLVFSSFSQKKNFYKPFFQKKHQNLSFKKNFHEKNSFIKFEKVFMRKLFKRDFFDKYLNPILKEKYKKIWKKFPNEFFFFISKIINKFFFLKIFNSFQDFFIGMYRDFFFNKISIFFLLKKKKLKEKIFYPKNLVGKKEKN